MRAGSIGLIPLAVVLGAEWLVGPGCATTASSERSAKDEPGPGRVLPPITVQSLSGGTAIDLGRLRGKVLLVDIWASWCGPCKEELPLLDELARRLKGQGIEFVAISIDEERASASAFVRSRPRWSLTLAHDPAGKVPALLEPPKMPTSYVVDREGVIRHVNAGFERGDLALLEQRLSELAAR
jgi:thiol-disulfide isomerase/thioredoxin